MANAKTSTRISHPGDQEKNDNRKELRGKGKLDEMAHAKIIPANPDGDGVHHKLLPENEAGS